MWVGIAIQPHTYKGHYDFQKWLRNYQFWVRTAADGSFSIPHVVAGENYGLWAFGPGCAGTFLSHELTGGKPPVEQPKSAQVLPAGSMPKALSAPSSLRPPREA